MFNPLHAIWLTLNRSELLPVIEPKTGGGVADSLVTIMTGQHS
jgi:hypothetical protein